MPPTSSRHARPRRGLLRLSRKRAVAAAATAASLLGAQAIVADSAWATHRHAAQTSPVTVRSLTLSSAAVSAGTPVTAQAVVSSTQTIQASALTVAVRSATGGNYDFGGAKPVTITSTPLTFTSASRSFPAGAYTYFVSYEADNVWHPLSPVESFTVGDASPPSSPTPTPVSTSSSTPTPVPTSTPSTSATPSTSTTPTASGTPSATPSTSATPSATPSTSTTPSATPTTTATPSTGPTTAAAPTPTGVPGTWSKLLLDDEFDGSSLNTSHWSTGWGAVPGITPPVNSEESDCYDPNQVAVSGGTLHLTLVQKTETCAGKTEPYASGLISTQNKFNFTYGALEARVYTPAVGGQIANWPAFWADGQNWPTDGELDVMEGLGGEACFHFHSASGGPGGCAPGTFTGWHTYGAVWAPGSVTYYYDGVKVGQITSGITGQPMYIILNQAVSSVHGGPLLTPADMQVDYVRVWQQ